jgi:hypothetical protein
VKDPVLVLGWIWAAYLAIRLVGGIVDMLVLPRLLAGPTPSSSGAASHQATHPAGAAVAAPAPPRDSDRARPGKRHWSPLPAILWLAGEACIAAVVVGVAWLYLRDATPNLVPTAISANPADVRRVAVAVIVGWSLFVINVPMAIRLIDRLLPPDTKKSAGGVDPEQMGATIGVLERLLVVALLPGGGATAVGFVVAAKTLARFKELDKKRFAERYLLGTMASVTIALVSAFAAQWVWVHQL